jgi:DNA invertase Pin-like site-specific DNA recombinase
VATEIFAALAALERETSAERARAGLASARARGRNGGRPFRMTTAQLRRAQAAMRQGTMTVGAPCAAFGFTRQALYQHVDPSGQLRPRGRKLLGLAGQSAEAGVPPTPITAPTG